MSGLLKRVFAGKSKMVVHFTLVIHEVHELSRGKTNNQAGGYIWIQWKRGSSPKNRGETKHTLVKTKDLALEETFAFKTTMLFDEKTDVFDKKPIDFYLKYAAAETDNAKTLGEVTVDLADFCRRQGETMSAEVGFDLKGKQTKTTMTLSVTTKLVQLKSKKGGSMSVEATSDEKEEFTDATSDNGRITSDDESAELMDSEDLAGSDSSSRFSPTKFNFSNMKEVQSTSPQQRPSLRSKTSSDALKLALPLATSPPAAVLTTKQKKRRSLDPSSLAATNNSSSGKKRKSDKSSGVSSPSKVPSKDSTRTLPSLSEVAETTSSAAPAAASPPVSLERKIWSPSHFSTSAPEPASPLARLVLSDSSIPPISPSGTCEAVPPKLDKHPSTSPVSTLVVPAKVEDDVPPLSLPPRSLSFNAPMKSLSSTLPLTSKLELEPLSTSLIEENVSDDPVVGKLKTEIELALSECKCLRKELQSTKSKLRTSEQDKKNLQQQLASLTPATSSAPDTSPCDEPTRQLRTTLEASKVQITMLEKEKLVLAAKLQQLQLLHSPNRKPAFAAAQPFATAPEITAKGKPPLLSVQEERYLSYFVICIMVLLSIIGMLTRTPMCPCSI